MIPTFLEHTLLLGNISKTHPLFIKWGVLPMCWLEKEGEKGKNFICTFTLWALKHLNISHIFGLEFRQNRCSVSLSVFIWVSASTLIVLKIFLVHLNSLFWMISKAMNGTVEKLSYNSTHMQILPDKTLLILISTFPYSFWDRKVNC